MEQLKETTETTIPFDIETEDTLKDKYLTFRVERETYGIEIRHVTEIVVLQPITHVPDMPQTINGVINLRGTVIPVMDVRIRLAIEEKVHDDRTCIIVVDLEGQSIGLIVDSVQEVLDIPADQVDLPPRMHSGLQSNYISGLGKTGDNVIILLNIENILHEEELAEIQ